MTTMMMMLVSVQRMFSISLLAEGPTRRASVLVNFIILLTYPTNFFIYCAMSTQFRATFRGMFTAVGCCRRTLDNRDAAAAASVAETAGNGNGRAMLMIQMNHTATGSQL